MINITWLPRHHLRNNATVISNLFCNSAIPQRIHVLVPSAFDHYTVIPSGFLNGSSDMGKLLMKARERERKHKAAVLTSLHWLPVSF